MNVDPYLNSLGMHGREYCLQSYGPDLTDNFGFLLLWGGEGVECSRTTWPNLNASGLYDPTNGTVSRGDIVRMGPWTGCMRDRTDGPRGQVGSFWVDTEAQGQRSATLGKESIISRPYPVRV